jgi:hypothetical protein
MDVFRWDVFCIRMPIATGYIFQKLRCDIEHIANRQLAMATKHQT